MAGVGLTGCENPGKKAGEAFARPPHSQSPHHTHGPTVRAARVFLHKTFVLDDHGQAERACAFSESKPYLAVDRTCAADVRRVVSLFHAHGMSAVPKTTVVHVHGTSGTAIFTWVVTGHRASSRSYLQYDGHRWWMTGEQKTGDLGL
jgi:hypothetical protein